MTPIITSEQGEKILEALRLWQVIYYAEKGVYPEWNYANITKSCLLGRLLYEGKEPLPVPPPRAYSAPWYKLIEVGRAYLIRKFDIYDHDDHMNICQDVGWVKTATLVDGTVLLEYPKNGKWLLRSMVEGEQVNPEKDAGYCNPTFADVVLSRIED